jgi:hypothetical protein
MFEEIVMSRLLGIKTWLALAAFVVLSLGPGLALAHENRDQGEYRFTVGFMSEPAYEGIKNGVDLRVRHVQMQGTEEVLEPVEGLEESLQVEVTHVDSGVSRVFPVRAVFGSPGRYTADLIPTAPGVYQFRFFGSVEGMDVDETFVSYGGGGGFNDVHSATELQFPEPVPQARELEGAVRGAQSAAQEAQVSARDAADSAGTASTLGIIGIVLGALGLVSGAGGVALAMRKR